MNLVEKKKVVVAFSGGVDSSVSAYILKKQGYQVLAVFMQNWDDYFSNQKTSSCSQYEDWNYAKKIAKQLDIKIYKVDFVKEYWEEVFSDFLRAIKSGLTPNPDILCNKFVKFNHFVKYVEKEFSTNLISTGHYAKVEKKGENFYLRKPKDRKKDQTYFLCKVDRKILSRVIFPINDLEKKTVREIAFINKLSNHQKKDSTGICFIGENKFEKFISNYIKPELGDIIEIESGKKIGSHNGYFLFTIGQRKGLGISGLKSPRYVVGKNPEKNLVYVSSGWDSEYLYSMSCELVEFNWLIDNSEIERFLKRRKLKVKFRYRQADIDVKELTLHDRKKSVSVKLYRRERAITPGQYAVFYQGEICIGGGLIRKTDRLDEFCNPLLNY